MIKKILLATDFSEPAASLKECLPEFKNMGMDEVVLFHAVSVVKTQASALEVQRYYEEQLHKEKEALEQEGYKVKVRVPLGFPPEEIINCALKERADLILVGSHGGGLIRSLFLGSTTFDVVRMTTVPVLVEKFINVGKKDYAPLYLQKFNRILYPTDFSECARKGWHYLLNFIPYLKEVVLVSVVGKVKDEATWKEKRDRSEQELMMMKHELEEKGCTVRVRVTEGTPSREIMKVADDEKVSMIMMPKRGQGYISQLLLGSTADAVLRQSRQPVLLIPCQPSTEQED